MKGVQKEKQGHGQPRSKSAYFHFTVTGKQELRQLFDTFTVPLREIYFNLTGCAAARTTFNGKKETKQSVANTIMQRGRAAKRWRAEVYRAKTNYEEIYY